MSDKRDIRDKCENQYLTNNRFIVFWKCLQIELDVHPSVVEDIQKQNEMCTVLFVNVACSIIQIVKFSTKVNLAFNNQMYSPKHHIYQKCHNLDKPHTCHKWDIWLICGKCHKCGEAHRSPKSDICDKHDKFHKCDKHNRSQTSQMSLTLQMWETSQTTQKEQASKL